MDSPPSSPSRQINLRRIFSPAALIVALALGAYAWLTYTRVSPYVGGSDSSGYYNGAKLLAQGKVAMDQRIVPSLPLTELPPGAEWLYVPLGFTVREDKTISPGYPVGLSALTLLAAQVVGWDYAPGLMAGTHLFFGVILFYLLARAFGLTPGWSLFGTVILALSPLYLAMGLQPMSDTPSLVWCEAAVLFVLWSRQRQRQNWAIAAGACFAVTVLMRPTNILLAAPLAIALGFDWRCWTRFILGGLPGLIVLLVFNKAAYGNAIATGYGNMTSAFGTEFFWPTVRAYAHWLPLMFTPVIALALLLPAHWRKNPRDTAALLSWALAFAALYSVYFCTANSWDYQRFMLPAVPALIVGALLVAQDFAQWRKWNLFSASGGIALGVVSVVLLGGAAWFNWQQVKKFNALDGKPDDGSYFETAVWLRKNAPAGSAVFSMQSSGAIYAYTSFSVIRWDRVKGPGAAFIAERLAKSGVPLYAVLYPSFEIKDHKALDRLPGTWREVYSYRWAKIFLWENALPPKP